MERLWAPWRMPYLATAGAPADSCFFCSALASPDDRRGLILTRRPRAFLILNAYPYASGHLMAAPTRHVGAIEDTGDDEMTEAMALLRLAVRALIAVYRPDGFNVGLNQGRVAGAGVPGHLHLHVVPRWNGDTNFMPVIGDTKVLPESLDVTYDRLAAVLAGC